MRMDFDERVALCLADTLIYKCGRGAGGGGSV